MSRRGGLLAAALVAVASGCAWLPEPATEEAERIEALWVPYTAVAAGVAVLVLGLLAVVLVRDRRSRHQERMPSQVAYNIPVEVAYLVVPALALGWLVTGALRTQDEVVSVEGEADVVVEVIAFRWQWQFTYEGEDVTVQGTTTDVPELVLPAPATIEFIGTSQDVVHSLWVPDFLFKQDMVPGRTNSFQVDTLGPGEHMGYCAEFCGVDHSQMSFRVRTVPPDEFAAWLDENRTEEAS